MVSYCDHWMSVLRRASSTIASNGISDFELGKNDPYMALFKIAQMITVQCISRSHRLKVLIFGM